MNIIFLDVDGVLNCFQYYENLPESRKCSKHTEINDYNVQMLAKIYHACNAKIVLSSTWRELDCDNPSCKSMYQYLVDSLAKYGMDIIDKTPIIHLNRPLEIKTWLNERPNKNDIRFISLDDDFTKNDYVQYGIGECLVKTEFWSDTEETGGLQEWHVKKAIEILNGETNE